MVELAEPPETEAEVLRRAEQLLLERLPVGWSMLDTGALAERHIDRRLALIGPDGRRAMLVFEAKKVLEGRDIPAVRSQLDRIVRQSSGGYGLVVARYLSQPVRARLSEAGLSYIDATGNMRISISSPGLFMSDRGADTDPWRGPGRPRGTLKGAPAAKVVRAMSDITGPWTIRQLVEAAGTSTGATYRVVDFLVREGLAVKNSNGRVEVLDWARMLRRWASDYGFIRNSKVSRWIAPRGLPGLMKRMSVETGITYAVTGTLAAAQWAPYAPARSAMIYTNDAARAAEEWKLHPAEAGANVMLAEPVIDVVFSRARIDNSGVQIASPTQVFVDLMNGPGRSPVEAEKLLEWMQNNEKSWRF